MPTYCQFICMVDSWVVLFCGGLGTRLNDHLPGYLFTDHYNKIAGEYDHLFDHVFEAIVAVAVKHLNLSPDDRLAEIGGGTGEVAHLIWKMAGISCCFFHISNLLK